MLSSSATICCMAAFRSALGGGCFEKVFTSMISLGEGHRPLGFGDSPESDSSCRHCGHSRNGLRPWLRLLNDGKVLDLRLRRQLVIGEHSKFREGCLKEALESETRLRGDHHDRGQS